MTGRELYYRWLGFDDNSAVEMLSVTEAMWDRLAAELEAEHGVLAREVVRLTAALCREYPAVQRLRRIAVAARIDPGCPLCAAGHVPVRSCGPGWAAEHVRESEESRGGASS